MKHLTLSVFLAFLFPACAEMQQQFIDRSCNREGAFQQGYNDATTGTKMDSAFAQMCPSNPDEIRRAYREGFTDGQAHRPVEIHVVQEGNGAGWNCLEAYGTKTCGYDCLEAFGQVKCGQYPGDNCVKAYGEIKCGRHCRTEYGEVVCERSH